MYVSTRVFYFLPFFRAPPPPILSVSLYKIQTKKIQKTEPAKSWSMFWKVRHVQV